MGSFVKLKDGGAQGRLTAVNNDRFSVEFPDPAGPGGISRNDTEVTVFQLAHLGPASDPELCAWWDGAVREACSWVRAPSDWTFTIFPTVYHLREWQWQYCTLLAVA